MLYTHGQGVQDTDAPSNLSASASDILSRLTELHHRIVKVGDSLHGADLQPVGGKDPNTVAPVMHLQRTLDSAQRMLSECESAVSRIENRI